MERHNSDWDFSERKELLNIFQSTFVLIPLILPQKEEKKNKALFLKLESTFINVYKQTVIQPASQAFNPVAA